MNKNTKTVNINNIEFISSCFVCGQGIKLTQWEQEGVRLGMNSGIRICEECKQAILWAKKCYKNDWRGYPTT